MTSKNAKPRRRRVAEQFLALDRQPQIRHQHHQAERQDANFQAD